MTVALEPTERTTIVAPKILKNPLADLPFSTVALDEVTTTSATDCLESHERQLTPPVATGAVQIYREMAVFTLLHRYSRTNMGTNFAWPIAKDPEGMEIAIRGVSLAH